MPCVLQAQDSERDSTRAPRWYVPDHLPVQFAGNIGFLSAGLGYTSNHENYQLNLLYGYVPASVGLVDVHTITIKNVFPLTRYSLKSNTAFIPYLGLGLTVEVGGNAFFKNPSGFPEGYYDFPKNLHIVAFGGAKFQELLMRDFAFIRGVEFFAEAGTIDAYLWYKSMSSQIKFKNIFSLALGANFLLRH